MMKMRATGKQPETGTTVVAEREWTGELQSEAEVEVDLRNMLRGAGVDMGTVWVATWTAVTTWKRVKGT